MSDQPVSDDLRTCITKVIWKVFQNTPPIDATDDEWESWWNDSTQEEKALSYIQADAVIQFVTDWMREHIAGILHAHTLAENDPVFWRCCCTAYSDSLKDDYISHDAHVADAVIAAVCHDHQMKEN